MEVFPRVWWFYFRLISIFIFMLWFYNWIWIMQCQFIQSADFYFCNGNLLFYMELLLLLEMALFVIWNGFCSVLIIMLTIILSLNALHWRTLQSGGINNSMKSSEVEKITTIAAASGMDSVMCTADCRRYRQ